MGFIVWVFGFGLWAFGFLAWGVGLGTVRTAGGIGVAFFAAIGLAGVANAPCASESERVLHVFKHVSSDSVD